MTEPVNERRDSREGDLCGHGNFKFSCPKCNPDVDGLSTDIQKVIQSLCQGSKFDRTYIDRNQSIVKTKEGRTFTVDSIEDGAAPEISEVQALMERHFDPVEMDPEDVLREYVNGRTLEDGDVSKFTLVTLRDEEGKLASVVTGSPLL